MFSEELFIKLKSNFLAERSVNTKIESALVIPNAGLASRLSASQPKRCTGPYYETKLRGQIIDWIITALKGPWENQVRTLLCSRLQL